MRSLKKYLHILFSLGMLGLCVGVVRPEARRMIGEAWKPVADGLERVPVREYQRFDIQKPGSYVVFLDGPAEHPAWKDSVSWVQLVNRGARDVLQSHPVDHEYLVDGRRGVGIVQVDVQRAGIYDVSFSATAPEALDSGSFQFGLVSNELVRDQSWEATQLKVRAVGIGVLLVLLALVGLPPRS